MSYVKLCQLLNQNTLTVFYQETADGVILTNNIQSYPLTLSVEVIDWDDENQFLMRGKINSFIAETVTIESPVPDIRQEVYNQLVVKYPTLVK